MDNKYMAELVEKLNRAADAYYQKDDIIMSDFEYDRLYDELARLEAETGIILPDSPTQRVGFTVVSNLVKVRHASRMLSLDKTKEIPKLISFLGDNEGVLSWKLDGLTIVVRYENGELAQAVTRGNGEIGEDVTHNAKVFKNLPKKINFMGELVIRGEAVISFSEFEKINGRLAENEKYKNTRNLCSGTVRQLNSEIAARRNVSYFAFSMVSASGRELSNLKSENLEWLKTQGFEIVEYKKVNKDNLEKAVLEFEENIQKNDYASDGLVLTFDDIVLSRSLGETSKFPRDSIAFKWSDDTSETTLKEIIWNTSRTGLINPIAIFEPVELEGTTVERASLHNVSIVEGLKLGVGDRITVYKANMIIPQVAENLTQSATAEIPKLCFVCGGETRLKEDNGVKTLYCSNPNCLARQVRTIAHYASRDALNIEGFSSQTVEKFIEKGYLKNYSDIYYLERFADEIKSEKGFGVRSYENLINAVEKSKSARLPNFIYGLGIDNVGLAGAKLLCKYFDYDIDKIRTAEISRLVEIEGFGGVIASSLAEYFADAENMKIMDTVLLHLTFEEPQADEGGKIFDGLSFVITGDTVLFENRKTLQQYLEENGGKVNSSVTARTSYLINNDITSGSAKNKKARELNIPIITEEEAKNQTFIKS